MKGRFKKHQHPPFFLEDENFFKKTATLVVSGIEIELACMLQKSALDLNYHVNYQLYQNLAAMYPVLEYYSCSIAINLQRYRVLVNI